MIKLKLPTILGLLILIGGLVTALFLINSRQQVNTGASSNAAPKNVRFSNISDTSITVSWTTDINSKGFTKWGTTGNVLSKTSVDDSLNDSYVHSINITNLEPNSKVYLKINSNGKDYDNDGINWSVTTLSQKTTDLEPLSALGSVLKSDGITPAKAIVYITINGNLLSGLTSDLGNFIIPIQNIGFQITDNTPIDLTIVDGTGETSQAVLYQNSLKEIPTIIIGKTYDFRSLVTTNSLADQPKSSISVPEQTEISSRFEVQKTNVETTTNIVTIDSINNGETINTTDPEFFGVGPKNMNVQISIHSELQEVSLTTDSKGKWSWNPPKDLEPGEHAVTLSWRDTSGILRTITKNFVVSASEGPAFESSQSGTLTTPKTTPTTTLIPVKSTPIATNAPTPITGSLTPTFGLFIMGIGVLLSSIFVWNKQDA